MLRIKGKVKPNRGQGRKIGFPTINIPVPQSIKKDNWGVYFSLVKIGDKIYPGATHLGPPKAFHLKKVTCETHLLSLSENFYGKTVTKTLIFKFRDVEDFSNIALLKKQIKKDIKAAKKFFGM